MCQRALRISRWLILSEALALSVLAGCSDASDCGAFCGRGSAPGGGSGSDSLGQVGRLCASNSDCSGGLTCVSDLGLGTITLPSCTLDCSNGPAECESLGGVCKPFAGTSLCFEPCDFGSSDPGCSAEGTTCFPADNDSDAACVPFCFSDSQCSDGKVCDLAQGVCKDEVEPVLGYYESCDDLQEDECGGICADINDEVTVCSSPCTFASGTLCGPAYAPGLCAYVSEGGGLGDLGFCAELCNASGECGTGLLCDPFGNSDIAEALGYSGLCAPEEVGGLGGAGPD